MFYFVFTSQHQPTGVIVKIDKSREARWQHLRVGGEGGVSGHEEVKSRRGDERRDQTNQIVVHVAGVTQRCRADRHHR